MVNIKTLDIKAAVAAIQQKERTAAQKAQVAHEEVKRRGELTGSLLNVHYAPAARRAEEVEELLDATRNDPAWRAGIDAAVAATIKQLEERSQREEQQRQRVEAEEERQRELNKARAKEKREKMKEYKVKSESGSEFQDVLNAIGGFLNRDTDSLYQRIGRLRGKLNADQLKMLRLALVDAAIRCEIAGELIEPTQHRGHGTTLIN